jgi:hypothetical protein
MLVATPALLPTHFIVYPEWMACEPVLGQELHAAVVTDSSILGGQAMRVFKARWENLGSGERPWTKAARVVDTIDVADLESEAEHAYELLGARDGEEIASEGNAPDGAIVVDGGRTQRVRERFVAKLSPGVAARLVMRLQTTALSTVVVHVRAGERDLGAHTLEPGPWSELSFAVPADLAKGQTPFELVAEGGSFTSFHYWLTD